MVRRISVLVWFLSSVSLFAYAEPPVQVIYWKASDVEKPTQDELDSLRDVMVAVQSFFALEMDRHGFGPKTFTFNKIKVIEGDRERSEYTTNQIIEKESDFIEWGLDNQIYVVFLAKVGEIDGASGASQALCANIPEQLQYCNNLVVIPTESRHIIRPLLAHEIGHAFGLDHVGFEESDLRWQLDNGNWIFEDLDVMIHPLPVRDTAHQFPMTFKEFVLSEKDAIFLNNGGRLSVQQDSKDSDQQVEIVTDVNGDGYTDLSDCLIVRSGMSVESMYDTDLNDDGVTDILDLMLVKAAAHEAIAAAAPSRPRIKFITWGALKIQ